MSHKKPLYIIKQEEERRELFQRMIAYVNALESICTTELPETVKNEKIAEIANIIGKMSITLSIITEKLGIFPE